MILLIILVVLVFCFLVKAIQIVPNASAVVVERFGRYSRTLDAGPHFVTPLINTIRSRVDLREQSMAIAPQEVTTRDHRRVDIDVTVGYQVADARAAVYGVDSFTQAIEQLAVATVRGTVDGMDLEPALTSREVISTVLRSALDRDAVRWGVAIRRVDCRVAAASGPVTGSPAMEVHADPYTSPFAPNGGSAGPRNPPQPLARTSRVPGHRPLGQGDPRRIGRYSLTAVLGQGGMGTVYLGQSPGRRLVAVKVIRSELAEDPTFRRRFAIEISAAGLVGGFHTASVVDADPHGDPPWLATEYIPGPSLQEVLKQQGAMPPRTLHTLAVGVAEALERIHACGIVHRDLKPANIIISDSGPRIIDFGIARALDSTGLTSTNYVIGTEGFVAPERLTGGAVTAAADLYAFGMVLCHAAGAAPLAAGESLASAVSLLPSRLAGTVNRCLDHDPRHRPTAAEVLELLSQDDLSAGDWLPLPVRTMVDLYSPSSGSAP
ncbi:protein kinase domain-containing protein [Streptomyces sp. CBMA123]|uniref:protein kinase domain-containing protein n=1 Tax=Streptomyces sp. CBMA123 TaxID=1896313 RepID=UPI001CB83747|nr:SPFH domain-containing protein [Streptomyces sp. CBMA123]